MGRFATEFWPQTASQVEFIPSKTPPDLPVTAVKIFVFQQDKLLLAHVTGRGWDLPGGHIEPGETPVQAIVRELKEETGAAVERFALIGYLQITTQQQNEHNRKYPKQSCILVYKGAGLKVDQNHRFQLEASESRLFAINELPTVHHNWNQHKAQVVAYARAVVA